MFLRDFNKKLNIYQKIIEGWLETRLPELVMTKLQSYIEIAKKNPVSYNDQLAGNVSKSLVIEDKDDWFFNTILSPLINQYVECFPAYLEQMNFFHN